MGTAETGKVRYCSSCRAVYDADYARCPNDGGELDVGDVDPMLGTTVGHYVVDAFIGAGAMGRVYHCTHVHLEHKQYALKILRGDHATTMAMRLRFTQEAEAASRLVHPNVVSVVDFGRTDAGLLYLVMDYVEGVDLATVIAQGPIAPARTIRLARELCRGLTHAHDLGFVHRDFKPDNIIVVTDGVTERPRIADFGLAIHAGPDATTARVTVAGVAVGTPTYAAPEQMQLGDEVDHRADLFALGVTLFEMLAGRTPFEGGVLETMHLNIAGERPSIASRALAPVDVPPRLERLVRRLMAPDRDDRPRSTRDVLDELDAIELELEHPVAAVSLPPAPSRRRWPIAAVAVGGVAALAVAAYALWPRAHTAPLDVAPAAPSETTRLAVPPPAPVPPAAVAFADPAPAHDAVHAGSPDIGRPDAKRADARDAGRSDTRRAGRPDIGRSHGRPDTGHPDSGRPDSRRVDARIAELVGPDGGRTGSASSGLGAGHPDTGHPDTGHPDTGQSTANSDAGSDTAPSDTGRTAGPSDAGRQDAGRPDTGRPTTMPDPIKPPKVATVARLSVEGLSVRGALTPAQIRRALERQLSAVAACYGPAATKAGRSPRVSLRTRFEIDETQQAHAIQTTGGDLPGLGTCVDRVLSAIRTEAAPDVGTVDVTMNLTFAPETT